MRDEMYSPPEVVDEPEGSRSLELRDVLTAVRRRWWLVLAAAVVVAAIGTWRTLHEPRLYRAAATVRVEQNPAPISGMQTPVQRMSWNVDPLQSEQTLIRSQKVAEIVADRLGLRLQPAGAAEIPRSELFAGAPLVDSAAPLGAYRLELGPTSYSLRSAAGVIGPVAYGDTLRGAGLRFVVPREHPAEREVPLTVASLERAADIVRDGISTRILPQTDIIEIAYVGTDPALVRDIADATAHAYQEFSSEGQRRTARKKSEFILASVKEQGSQLAQAQDALKRFKEQHQTSDVAADVQALFGNVHDLEEQRREALVEQEIYRQLVGKVTQADTIDDDLRRLAGTDAVSKNTYIQKLYDRWFELQQQREDLVASGLNAQHRDVQAIDKTIARTKRDLQFASSDYLQTIQSRLRSYEQGIGDLRKQADRYPPLEAEQARLMADVKTAQKTYDDLLEQLQLARIAENAETGMVRLIDAADLPGYAISPHRKRAVLFSALIGVLLGLGLAIGLERLDDSVKSPDELTDRFQAPVLGLIPAIRRERGATDAVSGRLVTHEDPRSPVAEAYRSLRTNLAFARAHQRLQAMVLTSPGPADGKSTTVANMAITFAQQGQRTLVIDADLRRSVLDRTFGVQRSPGLTEVIVGATPLEQAIQSTEIPNLSVLSGGQLPPNPAELLGSPEMRAALGEARRLFDVVIIDSPPLLAVTDAAVLSTIVDGTILVVRAEQTERGAVQRALSMLRAVHSRVLGAVLNDVDFAGSAYYSKYGYYSYYSYYGESTAATGGVLARLRRAARARVGAGR